MDKAMCCSRGLLCYTEPPYGSASTHGGEEKEHWHDVGLGMSCAQLRLPPLGATVTRAGEFPGYGLAVDLPPGYSWYGEKPATPQPAPEPAPVENPVGNLEVPADGSFQSGIGYIRGWVCDGREVEIFINDGLRLPASARGLDRADTEEVCGNRDNGFILAWNWNLMGDRQYTASLVADGQTVQRNTFTVTTLGQE